MRPEVKVVRDFWLKRNPYFNLDTDVLALCVESLKDDEIAVLSRSNVGTDDDDFIFVVNKVFNRHNDVCAGATEIEKQPNRYVIKITSKSCITELDLSWATIQDCNANYIYHIEDIDREALPSLSFSTLCQLCGAIVDADRVELHSDDGTTTIVNRSSAVSMECEDKE